MVVENIVCYCDVNGLFKCCKDLLKVVCLGEKIFEQCVGFLCIVDGDELLDVLVVYLEVYVVVECIVVSIVCLIKVLIGDGSFLCGLKVEQFIDVIFGVLIVCDIFKELEKLG